MTWRYQDEALAIDLAIQGVRHCLSICGLMTPAIQDAVIAEGFVDLLLFAELHDKDIHEMVKSINTNPIPPPFQVQRAPVRGGGGHGCGRGHGQVQPPLIGLFLVANAVYFFAFCSSASANYFVLYNFSIISKTLK
jgi:hypothetical protein